MSGHAAGQQWFPGIGKVSTKMPRRRLQAFVGDAAARPGLYRLRRPGPQAVLALRVTIPIASALRAVRPHRRQCRSPGRGSHFPFLRLPVRTGVWQAPRRPSAARFVHDLPVFVPRVRRPTDVFHFTPWIAGRRRPPFWPSVSARRRNVTTRRAAIGNTSPVLGFRPGRSPLSRSMKLPNPESLTGSLPASAPATSSKNCATISLASRWLKAHLVNQALSHLCFGQRTQGSPPVYVRALDRFAYIGLRLIGSRRFAASEAKGLVSHTGQSDSARNRLGKTGFAAMNCRRVPTMPRFDGVTPLVSSPGCTPRSPTSTREARPPRASARRHARFVPASEIGATWRTRPRSATAPGGRERAWSAQL